LFYQVQYVAELTRHINLTFTRHAFAKRPQNTSHGNAVVSSVKWQLIIPKMTTKL